MIPEDFKGIYGSKTKKHPEENKNGLYLGLRGKEMPGIRMVSNCRLCASEEQAQRKSVLEIVV